MKYLLVLFSAVLLIGCTTNPTSTTSTQNTPEPIEVTSEPTSLDMLLQGTSTGSSLQ